MTTSLTIADEGMAKHSTTNPHITVFTADGEIQIPIYKLGDGRFCVTWYELATGTLTMLRKRQRPDAVKIARQVCARRATRYRLALPIDVYHKLEAQKAQTEREKNAVACFMQPRGELSSPPPRGTQF